MGAGRGQVETTHAATDRRECHFGARCGVVELGRHGWLGAREERAAPETRSRSTGVRTHDVTRVTVWVVVKIDAVDTRGGSARRFSRRKADGTDSGGSLERTTMWVGVGPYQRGTSAASTITDRRESCSACEHVTAVPTATVPALATAHERLYPGGQGLCGWTCTKRTTAAPTVMSR